MKYYCNTCDYSTTNKGNWYKHKKSQKHVSKIGENIEETTETIKISHIPHNKTTVRVETKKHVCSYCNIEFSRSDSLLRHYKTCKKKEEDELDKLNEEKYELLAKEFEKYKKEKNMEIKNKQRAVKLKTQLEFLKEKINFYETNIQDIKEQYENHIDTLKIENKYQRQLIESAGGMIKKSMNTMSFLLMNYNNAPQLECLPDYSIITKDTETLIKDLVHYNRKGKLAKYIGDFIVKQYKKDSPELQAFWSSDIERLNYFVRELINNKGKDNNDDDITNNNQNIIFEEINDNEYYNYTGDNDEHDEHNIIDYANNVILNEKKNTIEKDKNNINASFGKNDDCSCQSKLSSNKKINWIVDKKGIRVMKSIIQPLLEYIKKIGIKYLEEKNKIITKLNIQEATKLYNDMQEIGTINCGIINKSTAESINKYIAPHFFLNK